MGTADVVCLFLLIEANLLAWVNVRRDMLLLMIRHLVSKLKVQQKHDDGVAVVACTCHHCGDLCRGLGLMHHQYLIPTIPWSVPAGYPCRWHGNLMAHVLGCQIHSLNSSVVRPTPQLALLHAVDVPHVVVHVPVVPCAVPWLVVIWVWQHPMVPSCQQE